MISFPTLLKHAAPSRPEKQSNGSIEDDALHSDMNSQTLNSSEPAERVAPASPTTTRVLQGNDGRAKLGQEINSSTLQHMRAPVEGADPSAERRRPSVESPGNDRTYSPSQRSFDTRELQSTLPVSHCVIAPGISPRGSSPLTSIAKPVFPRSQPSIDDLVRELLYPMIKQWLDENLPSVVERLVTKEIERLTQR